MPQPTGPDFDVDQGTVLNWTLDASSVSGSLSPEATAVVMIGRRRDSHGPSYFTVQIDDAEIDGTDVNVTVDTTKLRGMAHLWQVDVITPDNALIHRWRGTLLVTGGLPSTLGNFPSALESRCYW